MRQKDKNDNTESTKVHFHRKEPVMKPYMKLGVERVAER